MAEQKELTELTKKLRQIAAADERFNDEISMSRAKIAELEHNAKKEKEELVDKQRGYLVLKLQIKEDVRKEVIELFNREFKFILDRYLKDQKNNTFMCFIIIADNSCAMTPKPIKKCIWKLVKASIDMSESGNYCISHESMKFYRETLTLNGLIEEQNIIPIVQSVELTRYMISFLNDNKVNMVYCK
jgi:hypothetical protein